MRKRTVKCMADTIFWYIFYMLPILYFALYIIAFGHSGSSFFNSEGIVNYGIFNFNSFINYLGMYPSSGSGSVYSILNSLFGYGGIFPLFQNTTIPLVLCAYFINVYLLHLLVDFCLFIPRLAHKWMNYFTKSED